jgi:hypothetical protein
MVSLPYVSSPGNIDKALNGIKAAAVPERVSQDFVKTILKIAGGSGDQMTSFLKKLGLANGDGKPNELYRKFRNPNSSGAAIAKAIRTAYSPLYVRNEFAHELSDEKLLGLIVEETGLPHDASPVKLALACIKHLKNFADFNSEDELEKSATKNIDQQNQAGTSHAPVPAGPQKSSRVGLNLGYTINLNLPATSDSAVFDAIFRSLKENLLRGEDA